MIGQTYFCCVCVTSSTPGGDTGIPVLSPTCVSPLSLSCLFTSARALPWGRWTKIMTFWCWLQLLLPWGAIFGSGYVPGRGGTASYGTGCGSIGMPQGSRRWYTCINCLDLWVLWKKFLWRTISLHATVYFPHRPNLFTSCKAKNYFPYPRHWTCPLKAGDLIELQPSFHVLGPSISDLKLLGGRGVTWSAKLCDKGGGLGFKIGHWLHF